MDSLQVNQYFNALPGGSAATTFTTYGPVGQYVEGNFTIPFTSSGNGHTLTGNFRLKRD
jgi:hypothetical protein